MGMASSKAPMGIWWNAFGMNFSLVVELEFIRIGVRLFMANGASKINFNLIKYARCKRQFTRLTKSWQLIVSTMIIDGFAILNFLSGKD